MAEQELPISYPFPPSHVLYHPSPVYAQLREEQPVVRIRTPDGNIVWLASRYADVRQVLTDGRFSRAAAAGPGIPLTGLARLAEDSMLGMDPPDHSRIRRLVGRALTARRISELRPHVVKLVDDLLLALKPLPRPVDLVEHFSLPLPILVISELLGVPTEDRNILHGWSDTVMGDWDGDPKELIGYFTELIAAKRARPADDLMSALIAARDDEDKLTENELMSQCVGLLIAGHETTVAEINMGLLTLLHHPDQIGRLQAEPELIPQAVEEMLRFVQISAGGGTLPRVTTEEVKLGGVQLPAGSAVMTATNSANRDSAAFAEPDRLDICRGNVQHLTFGTGAHYCLGAPLARMQLQETLRGVLRHMPDIRVVTPDSELRFKRGMTIRSLEALPVTW
jgi:cytochrome P450